MQVVYTNSHISSQTVQILKTQTDLDVHWLQRQGIFGSRTRFKDKGKMRPKVVPLTNDFVGST